MRPLPQYLAHASHTPQTICVKDHLHTQSPQMGDDAHKTPTHATRPGEDEHRQDDVPEAVSRCSNLAACVKWCRIQLYSTKKNDKSANPAAWLISLFRANQQPKAVAVRDRSKAFAQALVHLPSIGVTFGVLSLSFRTVFWQAPAPNMNSILNALQFAAKLHETLILMSLSAIVLHRTRYDLLGPRGVSRLAQLWWSNQLMGLHLQAGVLWRNYEAESIPDRYHPIMFHSRWPFGAKQRHYYDSETGLVECSRC